MLFRVLLGILLLVSSQQVLACSGPVPVPFPQHFREANSIFVFRLETLALVEPMTSAVSGRIRIVRTLKGKTPKFKYIRFTSHACGGMRLDVGHYFVALADQNGSILSPSPFSLLDLRWQYSEDASNAINDRQDVLRQLMSAISTGRLPPGFPLDETLQVTQYMTPLPPPSAKR